MDVPTRDKKFFGIDKKTEKKINEGHKKGILKTLTPKMGKGIKIPNYRGRQEDPNPPEKYPDFWAFNTSCSGFIDDLFISDLMDILYFHFFLIGTSSGYFNLKLLICCCPHCFRWTVILKPRILLKCS